MKCARAPEFAARRRRPVPVAAGHGWKLGDGFRAARAIMKGAGAPDKGSVLVETPLARFIRWQSQREKVLTA